MVNVFKINNDMEKQIKAIEASLNILYMKSKLPEQDSDDIYKEVKHISSHLKKLRTLVNKNEEQISAIASEIDYFRSRILEVF